MAVSYPLDFPSVAVPKRMKWAAKAVVGVARSPFTLTQQVTAMAGAAWGPLEILLPPMQRADAAAVIGFLLALNGQEGTFLMAPQEASPRGSWVSPVVNGSQAAGVKSLAIRGVDGLTWSAGDYFQLGSGSGTHLHMVTRDGQQVGSPSWGLVECWPPLRAAVSDAATITLTSPKGLWRLASSEMGWDIDEAMEYGVGFSVVEAL